MSNEIPVPGDPGDHTPGNLYKIERIGNPSALALQILLWWANVEELVPISQGINLYRVQYWTQRFDGAPIVASGLVAVPGGGKPRGVVSYQHATTCRSDYVPSAIGLNEGTLGAAIFGGSGFLFVAADYIGLGVSEEVHPYLYSASEVSAVADLLKAANMLAEHVGCAWSNSVYLIGFSQGGHATMAAHRALEATNDPRFQVAASAAVAGPYDLAAYTFPNALATQSKSHSVCIAYMVNAYCTIYGYPESDVLKEEYAATVPALFDGTHYSFEVEAALPANPRDMFRAQFLNDYDNGRNTWLLTALAENEAYKWTPRAPVRLYYGEGDTMVSPEEARMVYEEFRRRGCSVELDSVGDYDHFESIVRSAPMIRRWFSQISATRR
jgi:pimeloyl-ACP methyl ester carboxylesterase